MKTKTNRQVLTKAIKELNDFDLVILRERIITMCDHAINNEEQIRKDMERNILSPDLYFDVIRSIKSKVEF